MKTYTIGVDLGGTNIKAGLVDEVHHIVDSVSCKTNLPRPEHEVEAEIAALCSQLAQRAGLDMATQIESVGIGTPGSVNPHTGVVEFNANFGYRNWPLVSAMEKLLPCRVYIENDANAAAYGEYIAGAAQGAKYAIAVTLGTGIGEDFDLSKLRYNRVIILSDADQDGAHIRAILLTFFYRYMKELITEGHVYIGMPPLYKVQRGNKVQYAYDDAELRKLTRGQTKGYTLQRYKGLGEMNPEQLWQTTMDPEQRKLMRVSIEDAAQAERLVTILMGDKVEPRRQYISQHANFNREDRFEALGGGAGEGRESR